MWTQRDLVAAGAADGVPVAADNNRDVAVTVELVKTHVTASIRHLGEFACLLC